jgi:hypothetical protein
LTLVEGVLERIARQRVQKLILHPEKTGATK